MPAEGLAWLDRSEILDFEEILRVARVCVDRLGFDGIHLTGGEPTVRARLPRLVEMLAGLNVNLSLTTNGATLGLLAKDLSAAGLDRVTISCDSLRPDRFESITRRNALAAVLEGIEAAVTAGLNPVKVNCVVMRGVNDDEVADFARFGRDRGVEVRFIEYMPLDADGTWDSTQVFSAAEIVDCVLAVFGAEPVGDQGSSPAQKWRYIDGRGGFGVIASVTRSFCASCDRARLTADGMFRNCLFAQRETDLRPILRGNGTDDALVEAIAGEVGRKWAGHSIGQVNFVRANRSMSQIGG